MTSVLLLHSSLSLWPFISLFSFLSAFLCNLPTNRKMAALSNYCFYSGAHTHGPEPPSINLLSTHYEHTVTHLSRLYRWITWWAFCSSFYSLFSSPEINRHTPKSLWKLKPKRVQAGANMPMHIGYKGEEGRMESSKRKQKKTGNHYFSKRETGLAHCFL